MSGIKQMIMLIVILGLILFAPLVVSKNFPVPYWLKEGVYAVYKVDVYEVMFNNGTWIWFESPVGEGSYLMWRIVDLNNTHATFEILLNIELRNTKIRVIRNFNLKGSEEKVYSSGFIRREVQAIVDIYTGEVFVNGKKVGSTGLWLPPNLLLNGIKVRVGEVYGSINVRGILRGPYAVETSRGWVYAYVYMFDPDDEVTTYKHEIRLTDVKVGKVYDNLYKVVGIAYDPKENMTYVNLQNIRNPHAGVTVGNNGYWLNNLTDFGVLIVTGYKSNVMRSLYCYDPVSGLVVKASFFMAGKGKPWKMTCGDGLTAALGIRIFKAYIELQRTNAPLLMDEVIWRVEFFGILTVSLLLLNIGGRKIRFGKSTVK